MFVIILLYVHLMSVDLVSSFITLCDLLLFQLFSVCHCSRLSLLFCGFSGTGDGFFSSSFQSQLQGNPLYNASMPRRMLWFHYFIML